MKAVKSEWDEVVTKARGTVVTPLGFRLPFVITDVEPGVSWSWRVAGVESTGHRVIPIDENACRLEFTVPWPFAAYVIVLYVGLKRVKRIAEAGNG